MGRPRQLKRDVFQVLSLGVHLTPIYHLHLPCHSLGCIGIGRFTHFSMQTANCEFHNFGVKPLLVVVQHVYFSGVGPRPIVDLLIRVNQADLLYSLEDVIGGLGEPMARRTPLGWTLTIDVYLPFS